MVRKVDRPMGWQPPTCGFDDLPKDAKIIVRTALITLLAEVKDRLDFSDDEVVAAGMELLAIGAIGLVYDGREVELVLYRL